MKKKRFYEPPHMEVVELKTRQTLLVGSTPDGGIQKVEEEDLGDY